MLPTGEDAESMDTATMAYTFNLCAKAGAQMLQTSVQQQTYIDELRSQVRSLQTQVSNLTASIDEIENRIFVRLQSMQPTIYTREGIPFDDALDSITAKLQTQNEKIINTSEHLEKFDAEIQSKVDREDFVAANQEAAKTAEQFEELSNSLQVLQKELQKQRQESQDNNDRIMQSLKLQIQQNTLRETISQGPEPSNENFVTHEELRQAISKLKLMGPSNTSNKGSSSMEDSAIIEFTLGGEGVTQEKVKSAFKMLKKKQKDIDSQYKAQKAKLAEQYGQLMKVAEANQALDEEDESDIRVDSEGDADEDSEWEYEEDVDDDEYDSDEDENAPVELRSVAVDYDDGVVEEEVETRPYGESTKMRSIGLQINLMKKSKKTDKENITSSQELLLTSDMDQSTNEVSIDEEFDAPKRSKKSAGSKQKTETGSKKKSRSQKPKESMKSIINQMKEQKQSTVVQKPERGGRLDENRVTQRVLDTVMPRVENLLVDAFSGSKGGSGIKLERHEAKQLIDQLTTLDQIRNELRTTKTKVAQKADKSRVEDGFKVRLTRDELYELLYQLMPDNQFLETIMHNNKSNLPPLKRANRTIEPSSTNPINGSQTISNGKKSSILSKSQATGAITLVPAKNSKMLPINQKFARGNDGKYYYRDMSNDKTASIPNGGNPSIFGGQDSNVSAAFDFQGYMPVSGSKQTEPGPPALGGIREKTPVE